MTETMPARPSLSGLYVRNYAANISGNLIIILLNIFTPLEALKDWQIFLRQGGWVLLVVLIPLVFISAGVLQYLIQRPIATMLRRIQEGGEIVTSLQIYAKRRLLNLPVVIALVNLSMWITLSAAFAPFLHYSRDVPHISGMYLFFRGIMIGMLAAHMSFFLLDDYSRKQLVPQFFPEGRLAVKSRTIKISILRRIRVLFGAGTGMPMLILVGTLSLIIWELDDSVISASEFGKEIFIFIIIVYIIFFSIALGLNFLVGKSILDPIKEMMGIVKKVRYGDYHQKVRVVSNDELGVLGDGMNEMTAGLIERERMRESLDLAREVQQTLLPQKYPKVKGLDIASTIVYCDETGGDYYDFLTGGDTDQGKLTVVLGDVSGHGISSALLMASVRAFLRQRSALTGGIAQIVSDVNRQLAVDVEDTGGFMTLFYLTIDMANQRLNWVRAGHEPAIFYDPITDTFEELRGAGMALGVNADGQYLEFEKADLAKDQIILLGTDGIWEARNPKGEMFGKAPIYSIIRQYSDTDAKGLLTACLFSLEKFRDGVPHEDDVTLIVIKITQD
jgi:sigma-B regulation protein RsbU (phosphoserine phosphatase)